jgi:signal transduction histidine kinase
MTRLISDLLDVTRLEAGSLVLQCQPEPADGLLREALELHHTVASERHLTLELDAPSSFPRVVCDRERILQVLGNLLGNALKFTPGGGRITLRCAQEGATARFTVSDTGPGIPPEQARHVFDRFWQAERRGKAGSGIGLGLSIVKGLVEAHGGRTWVESTVGQGTAFHFDLPLETDTQLCGPQCDNHQQRHSVA